jgi:hypothetical protein
VDQLGHSVTTFQFENTQSLLDALDEDPHIKTNKLNSFQRQLSYYEFKKVEHNRSGLQKMNEAQSTKRKKMYTESAPDSVYINKEHRLHTYSHCNFVRNKT